MFDLVDEDYNRLLFKIGYPDFDNLTITVFTSIYVQKKDGVRMTVLDKTNNKMYKIQGDSICELLYEK